MGVYWKVMKREDCFPPRVITPTKASVKAGEDVENAQAPGRLSPARRHPSQVSPI